MLSKFVRVVLVICLISIFSGCFYSPDTSFDYSDEKRISSVNLVSSKVSLNYDEVLNVDFVVEPLNGTWINTNLGNKHDVSKINILVEFTENNIDAKINGKTSLNTPYRNNLDIVISSAKIGEVRVKAYLIIVKSGSDNEVVYETNELTINFSGYKISNADELTQLNNSSKHFELVNDIDLSTVNNWTPIKGFKGILDGNSHTISNLSIESIQENIGFFDVLLGEVHNIEFDNANIESSGSSTNAGIIAGKNSGLIKNVIVRGNMSLPNYRFVGGIAGYNDGFISDSLNYAHITATENVGGITGYFLGINGLSLNNNENHGNIIGKTKIGGILGVAETRNTGWTRWNVEIHNNINYGSIISDQDYAGGIVGYTSGNVPTSSYFHTFSYNYSKNYGLIEGRDFVGGIIGRGHLLITEIISPTNEADISGRNYVGGFVGYSLGTHITYAQNNNNVTGNAYVGGIAGYSGTIENSSNTGLIISKGSIVVDGKSGSFIGGIAGFAESLSNNENSSPITVNHGGNYVGGIAGFVNAKQSSTIDSNTNRANITSNGEAVGGLIGWLEITNTGWSRWDVQLNNNINDGDIVGYSNYVGGLFGYVSGNTPTASYHHSFSITNAINNGNVSGQDYTGGIVGMGLRQVDLISSSQNNGNISGRNYVGGYIGYGLDTVIQYCENQNAITGGAFIGGIAGYAGSIKNSKNSGSITSNNALSIDNTMHANVGGISGYAYILENNINYADISVSSGGVYVGGISGYVHVRKTSSIDSNENYGNIHSAGVYVGGIAGRAQVTTTAWDKWSISFNDNINEGNISGDFNYVGGIFGIVEGKLVFSDYIQTIVINNSTNKGSVSGNHYIGGVVGGGTEKYESIISSRNDGTISGKKFIGGIAGHSSYVLSSINTGDITGITSGFPYDQPIYIGGIVGKTRYTKHSTNLGNITNQSIAKYTGGIAGYTEGSESAHNTNEGIVISQGNYTGGITGYALITATTDIQYNVNKGSVSGMAYTGGIFGYLELKGSENNSVLSNTSNEGTITGKNLSTGGLIGELYSNSGSVLRYADCINTGNVTGTNHVGGILGKNGRNLIVPTISTCTNTGEITGNESSTGDLYGSS